MEAAQTEQQGEMARDSDENWIEDNEDEDDSEENGDKDWEYGTDDNWSW